MLIWCSKCGTSFDVEKRGSICPGCGYDTSGGVEKSKRKRKKKDVLPGNLRKDK